MFALLFSEKHQCYTPSTDFDEIIDHPDSFIDLSHLDNDEKLGESPCRFKNVAKEIVLKTIQEKHPEKNLHVTWYSDNSPQDGFIKRIFLIDGCMLNDMYFIESYMKQHEKDEVLVCVTKATAKAHEGFGYWGDVGRVTMEIVGNLYREGTLLKVKKLSGFKALDTPYSKEFLENHGHLDPDSEMYLDSEYLSKEDIMTKYGTLELEYTS